MGKKLEVQTRKGGTEEKRGGGEREKERSTIDLGNRVKDTGVDRCTFRA